LKREPQSGFRQQYADELLAYIESQGSFGVSDLGTSNGCLIARGLQAPLPLVTALEQVSDPDIELLSLIQIFSGEVLRTKKWDELGVGIEGRIRTEVRRDLLGLILKNQSSRGSYGMVVRQRQIYGLIKTDQRRILPTARPHQ
jgi:hypothetical protein